MVRSTTSLTTSSQTNAPVNFDGSDYIATFKASANLIVGAAAGSVGFDYLVIAGGASGGSSGSGGGGAGGFRTSFPGGAKVFLNPGPNAIVIGGGGAGFTTPGTLGNPGTDSFAGNIVSSGGGGGGTRSQSATGGGDQGGFGLPGGSGGGAAGGGGTGNTGGNGNVVIITPSQGNNGGNSGGCSGTHAGGGGGGAGAVGANTPSAIVLQQEQVEQV